MRSGVTVNNSRVAVVVGGGSGIGKAIAGALHEDGYRVTVADVNGPAAQAVAAEFGGHSEAVDVTDEARVEALFTGVREREGAVHVVVNTVGLSGWSPVVDHDVAQFRTVIDVNLVGAFLVLKHGGRVVEDGGALVSLTSLNGRQPGEGLAAYCSAKAGLSMLTQVAALELASRGVRVNAVAPGLVITPLTEGMQVIPGVTEDYLDNTPLGRAGLPEEVADAVVFLCSDRATWITGEVLDMNGGAHMMRYPRLRTHFAGLL
ncbi:SDR family NAD(P)-dependent oxidoreductase [Nocardia alba]|uniref:NAD(P)-dependent dehydrogenase (Short-subunit alcohol dehydrogenase family) n=1 Tax=Nocardia alba TaxID=225051 RepID=A0A4R1G0J2_9NOCA|nr:SDR family oxidoreductase [Nocardia alba]TCJ97161.1 NAD(P)-dependent dehydrogenase (short-subunit alcohol dehydrogenase family) [Nocardia alba]